MDAERYDAIVAAFYEAALEPRGWHDALLGVARANEAHNFHLMVWDPRRPHPLHSLTWEIDARAVAGYGSYYGAIDPRRLLAAQLPDGDWFVCQRHFDARAVARNEFFQDYLIPVAGSRYLLGGRLLHHAGFDVYFGMHRPPGRPPFDAAEIGTMQRLTGHFQRAARLWLDTESLRQRAALGERALETVATGVLATDAAGRVVYANRQAEALLRDEGPLGSRLGLLTAHGHDDAKCLGETLRVCATSRQARSLRIGVERAAGRRGPYSLTIVPLPAQSPFGGWLRAELLVLVTPGRGRRMPTPLQLVQLFDLTPAEARLSRALASGELVEAYAQSAGVSVTTVKTHLRSIFAKTGVTRQSELVRLLGAVPVVR